MLFLEQTSREGSEHDDKELTPGLPALLFRLIVVCPNLMEFCVDCCLRYVGLLFCPLHDLTWQKWFSTQSWLTNAGFITDEGNWVSFVATIALNPRHMHWISNQSFEETKLLLFWEVSSLQSIINRRNSSNCCKRWSFVEVTGNLSLKNWIILEVWRNSETMPSTWEPSLLLASRYSWYFYRWNKGYISHCFRVKKICYRKRITKFEMIIY